MQTSLMKYITVDAKQLRASLTLQMLTWKETENRKAIAHMEGKLYSSFYYLM